MALNFLKKQSWGLIDCTSGEFYPVEKMPFEIGSGDGVDLRLEGDAGVLSKHCALTRVRDGSLMLIPVEPTAGEVVVNGAVREQPFSLEPDQDYALRLGSHLLALRGGRDLKGWRTKVDHRNWVLNDQSTGNSFGPVGRSGIADLAASHGLTPTSTAVHPVGLKAGVWLNQLLPNYSNGQPDSAYRRQSEELAAPVAPLPVVPDRGDLTCPVCWMHCEVGDLMHVAVHESLRGDLILGEDAQPRFHATRFNDRGQALDALGLPCTELACPHCHSKLPPGFLDAPQHILSLVGNAQAGKSYYLTVLSRELPATLFRRLDLVWQDADPGGNRSLNSMQDRLYSAASAQEGFLAKTVPGVADMYLNVTRQGQTVKMPRPFVFNVSPRGKREDSASVIFYDQAGENFLPGRGQEETGTLHVAAASGIFFLYDPMPNREFRRRMAGGEDPQLGIRFPDQQDVLLAELKTRIMRTLRLDIGHKIDVPLAMMIGKLDAWHHLLPEDEPLYECLDKDGDGVKLDAIAHNSAVVRRLLLDVCPTVVANAESLSERVCYFPLSTFGHTPLRTESGNIAPDPARLAPILLEAPTLWMLQQIAPQIVRIAKPTLPDVAVKAA